MRDVCITEKNLRHLEPWVINLVSIVKQGGKVCARCRIKFHKVIEACDLSGMFSVRTIP